MYSLRKASRMRRLARQRASAHQDLGPAERNAFVLAREASAPRSPGALAAEPAAAIPAAAPKASGAGK